MADFEIKDGVCVIPERTTEISGWDFTGCSNLYEVVIPATVINISSFAFDDCTPLLHGKKLRRGKKTCIQYMVLS